MPSKKHRYNKLNNDDDIYMYPSELYFSQDSILGTFKGGKLLGQTFNEIIEGNRNPNKHIPPITVVKDHPDYEGLPFVFGCRRLYIYQELEKLDVIRKVKVEISSYDSQQHRIKNFTTKNDGVSVEVKSYAGQFNKNHAHGWNFYKNRYHFRDWEKSADRHKQSRSQHNNQPDTDSQDFTTANEEPESCCQCTIM
ncbi:unnamed protein product [Owenia fusiformis]|uniref:Uncharacterized protein n=1 Tax=Owenia fusiformis TaxID=6347 RepID=A0A8J1U0D3_OWEFU|nr:unnamed protein product [Owenia fusiformis]